MRTLLFPLLVWTVACGDAGDDWKSSSSAPALQTAMDVWSFSEEDTWILDGTETVHRTDGSSWTTLEAPSFVNCVFALSASDVYLCSGGALLHYDGTSFTSMDVSSPTGLSSIADVWASSPNDIFAVGDDAIVAHYDGSEWTRMQVDSNFNTSVWGAGPDDVYVMGTFDLQHYDGTTWSEVENDANGGDGQIWGTSASDVWIMTDSYDLYHFDGSTWSVEETDFVGDLAAVWGTAPDNLWGVGTAGSIARYDGDQWEELAHQRIGAPYLRQFVAVHGSSATNIWAVGYQLGEGGGKAVIYHYNP